MTWHVVEGSVSIDLHGLKPFLNLLLISYLLKRRTQNEYQYVWAHMTNKSGPYHGSAITI